MASARRLYTTFHHEGPRERYRRLVDWPDRPVLAGYARDIVYRSDKWHDGVQDYTHRVDGQVEVICDASLRRLGALPNPSRSVRLARPAGTVARIGDALELTFETPGGERRTVNFEAGPELYDSPELFAFDAGSFHYYAFPVRPVDRCRVVILRSKDMVIRPGGLDG